MLGAVADLTERKSDERELERRAQAAQALEFVGDGVFLLDASGIVRIWNPAAAAITGLREAEVVGRPLELALPGWADVERLIPVAETRHGGGVRAETLPVEIDGREVWLSISGVDFAEGTVYAFRDLTEERGLDRLKSDFVSTVSHELRTPLAAIYGAAMTLRREDVPLTVEQREGMLGVVSGEAERLARIVNDILLASRLDSDVVEVSIGNADAGELAASVVAAAKAHLPANVELRLVVPEELPPIAADADKLRQVLVNLVENGIKYSPDGGTVEVALTTVPGLLRFAVRDEGLGVPVAEQSRIFEKFYRLDPHLTRGVGGTGLGLYICREIVRRMDGRIWVDSQPGAGSTFWFELPLASNCQRRPGGRLWVEKTRLRLVGRAVLDVGSAPAGVGGAAPRRPEDHREHEADDADDHQDDADRVQLQAGDARVHGPGEDRADRDQEDADSKTHVCPPCFCGG
jgi:PAS domain S-box-containing protein